MIKWIYIYSPLVLTSETKMVPEDQKVNSLCLRFSSLFLLFYRVSKQIPSEHFRWVRLQFSYYYHCHYQYLIKGYVLVICNLLYFYRRVLTAMSRFTLFTVIDNKTDDSSEMVTSSASVFFWKNFEIFRTTSFKNYSEQ